MEYKLKPKTARFPREIVIELTHRCGLGCQYCFNRINPAVKGSVPVEEMTTQHVFEVIDALAKASIPVVRFTGGEPLLRKDLGMILSWAKKKKLYVILNTSAIHITSKLVSLFDDCVDEVLVSVNAGDVLGQRQQKKIQSLSMLCCSRIGVVRVGTVATKDSIKNLDSIFCFLQRHRIDTWQIFRPILSDKKESEPPLATLIRKIEKYQKKFNGNIFLGYGFPFCGVSRTADWKWFPKGGIKDAQRLIVDPAGFVKPSYTFPRNLGDARKIMVSWENPFVKKMRTNQLLPKECKPCILKWVCGGGSRVLAYHLTGRFNSRDGLMRGPILSSD